MLNLLLLFAHLLGTSLALGAIVALILVARKASYPQALMKPYRKGER